MVSNVIDYIEVNKNNSNRPVFQGIQEFTAVFTIQIFQKPCHNQLENNTRGFEVRDVIAREADLQNKFKFW